MSLRRLARNWDAFARTDPLWAILTSADKRGNRWSIDDFLATGVAEVDGMLRRVSELGLPLRHGRALDFGCGVGRLTCALADVFAEVDGVDIAAEMIAAAERVDAASSRRPVGCIRYHVNRSPDLAIFPSGTFDFVCSSITLQHMPPALIRGYLREFARVLVPGGLLVFQLPESPRRRANPNRLLHGLGVLGSRALRRARTLLSRAPTMDMYGMPRGEVCALLEAGGCDVPCVEASTLAGDDWHSSLYFARRRPLPVGSEPLAAAESDPG